MGQQVSCPCSTSNNVVFDDDEGSEAVLDNKRSPPVSTNPPTASESGSTNPFDDNSEDRDKVPPLLGNPSKSRRWQARTDDTDFSSNSTQRSGEDASGEAEGEGLSSENLSDALSNVKGDTTFANQIDGSSSGKGKTSSPRIVAAKETEAQKEARQKKEKHNDRIIATFNSVMLADGLKVLKHHRRSSKKAASRVIRFVPEYGGALVWDKPLRQPGAKASRVPLDAINQVELEQRIVWISAGNERVGFETSKTEDADLMYHAICILVDRCHA